MDDIIFLYKWRAKLAKCAVFIKSATDFVKMLKADCNLAILGIQDKIFLILEVILLAIENQDCYNNVTFAVEVI